MYSKVATNISHHDVVSDIVSYLEVISGKGLQLSVVEEQLLYYVRSGG